MKENNDGSSVEQKAESMKQVRNIAGDFFLHHLRRTKSMGSLI